MDGFLHAIISHFPDVEQPRLVFSDWLEEHGEGELAQQLRSPDAEQIVRCFQRWCRELKFTPTLALLKDAARMHKNDPTRAGVVNAPVRITEPDIPYIPVPLPQEPPPPGRWRPWYIKTTRWGLGANTTMDSR